TERATTTCTGHSHDGAGRPVAAQSPEGLPERSRLVQRRRHKGLDEIKRFRRSKVASSVSVADRLFSGRWQFSLNLTARHFSFNVDVRSNADQTGKSVSTNCADFSFHRIR